MKAAENLSQKRPLYSDREWKTKLFFQGSLSVPETLIEKEGPAFLQVSQKAWSGFSEQSIGPDGTFEILRRKY